MRIALGARPAGGQRLSAAAAGFADYEKAGVELFIVAELYGFDAVSRLGYVAARTTRAHIASGILQLYSRTPTLLAMTAAGLDDVSDGRFELGIGTSGPQVIEGFHGVPFDAPIGRTRETIEICRQVWRREGPVTYQGKHYAVPLPAGQGTGLGKPLKMVDHPFRDRIPVTVAAIGPRNVTLTAELAEGWMPPFYVPEKASDVWGASLRSGITKRDPGLGQLDVHVGASVAIGDDVAHLRELDRPLRALYIGGMGARGRNFYNDLACRFGYADAAARIQDLYLSGKKKEAEAAVPADLLAKTSLIGPEGYVLDRLSALAESGVTTLSVRPVAQDQVGRLRLIEQLRGLIDRL
ncbi:LLM class F420-dependent oxidoreductase [Streptomyces carpinensis]|nr:LLM class F420-dependent oxidoreductase [Streptomyces carpinensis]